MTVVSVWARRALVVLGIVVLIFGGLLRGPFVVGAVVFAGVLFVVAGRSPKEIDGTTSLVEVNGVTWTRDSAGRPNRWNIETQSWDVVDPAPPDVIRAFDRRPMPSHRPAASRAVSAAAVVVAVLLGLGVWALLDPFANIPFVSQVVCSFKGASWQEGSTVLEVPPGCYERTPDAGTSEPDREAASQADPTAEMDGALKDAATAEESYALSNAGAYTPLVDDLVAEGFVVPDAVFVQVVTVGPGYYCIEASHVDTTAVRFYDSNVRSTQSGRCPAVD